MVREFSPDGSGFSIPVERKVDRESLIKYAYQKAKSVIENYSVREGEFKDIYDSGMVDRDLENVKKMEKNLLEGGADAIENTKLSEIFNAILLQQFEINEWMGSDVTTIGTSKHDKFTTGIGNITEFKRKSGISYLAMAVRVTFSVGNLNKKLVQIKENIRKGQLSKIKYFESELHRGELKKVPNVIVGCDKKCFLKLLNCGHKIKIGLYPSILYSF